MVQLDRQLNDLEQLLEQSLGGAHEVERQVGQAVEQVRMAGSAASTAFSSTRSVRAAFRSDSSRFCTQIRRPFTRGNATAQGPEAESRPANPVLRLVTRRRRQLGGSRSMRALQGPADAGRE